MLRGPIEDKLEEKTKDRNTMKEFLERILKIEEAGKQCKMSKKSAQKTEKEALEEFLSYSWPGNITQVKRVLRQIMGSTEGALITKDTVKKFIRNEVFENMDDLSFNIDLNQTLSDINYDVIRLIMKQENMNQSRTAERLGVGRTTIWRILKQHEGNLAKKI